MDILLSSFVILLFFGFSSVLVISKNTPSDKLLVGDEEKLFLYDANGNVIEEIADVGAHSIDYDCKNKEIVWTSWDTKAVYVKGKKMITLPLIGGVERVNWSPKSVAVDPKSHKIYVGDNVKRSVIVYDKSKSNPKQIYYASGSKDTVRWHLAIDSNKDYLFIQSDYEITRTDLNGAKPKIIYSEHSEEVKISRITVDVPTKRVYWLNVAAGEIVSVNYEGSDQKVHYKKISNDEDYSNFDSLTILKGILYWVNFDYNKLIKLDLSGKTQKTVFELNNVDAHALKAINC